jgi:7-carboxy-7-deazaguanine synthase (Cx14CxxC type)
MKYRVKEIFYTLQGEGARSGRPAVFCRFSGCNLWSGREEHRERAICQFCDTDFVGTDGVGGGVFDSAEALAAVISSYWPLGATEGKRYVVCTGGEPLLQLNDILVDALHSRGFEIAVETNGTQQPAPHIDWLTVSPKAGSRLRLVVGNELKLVYPQDGLAPEAVRHLEFDNFYLQPMDGPTYADNLRATIDYCLANPKWKLSLQTHKTIGIR